MGRPEFRHQTYNGLMNNNDDFKKLKHDLRRPFSNLEMLITILKGSEMDKQRMISSLEKILSEGKEAVERLERSLEK